MSNQVTLPKPTLESYRLLVHYCEAAGHKVNYHILARITGMTYHGVYQNIAKIKKSDNLASDDTAPVGATGSSSASSRAPRKKRAMKTQEFAEDNGEADNEYGRPEKEGRAKRATKKARVEPSVEVEVLDEADSDGVIVVKNETETDDDPSSVHYLESMFT